MNPLPPTLYPTVSEILAGLGDPSAIRSTRHLSGGCINQAVRLDTAKNHYFLKWNTNPLPNMFKCEADGLALLAKTNTVRVPEVLGYADRTPQHPAFLLLEWLDGKPVTDQASLGEQLAQLHRSSSSALGINAYGLAQDNYIGSNLQVNTYRPDWIQFFIENRLTPQIELAIQRGNWTVERSRVAERFLSKIHSLLAGIPHSPALIHGDLWIGNVQSSASGPALIDPAVSFSDREAEIAYTTLFGGFGSRFYSAYQATWPLEPGFADRRDLYNVYHLLNHLNMFGESYGFQVDAIFHQYAG